MKRASRIAFAFVVVFVGLIAAGVAILKSLDFNEYRDLIAEKVQEATGREVDIAGDLTLGISLTPTLRVEEVTFANAEWGSRPEMVQLERLDASVELIPLLSGEARINRILLSGLDLLVETDPNGRGNWEFTSEEAPPRRIETARVPEPVRFPTEGADCPLNRWFGKSFSRTSGWSIAMARPTNLTRFCSTG